MNFSHIKYLWPMYSPMSSYVLILFWYTGMLYQAIYMACLWPVTVMDLYNNRGQVRPYKDIFWASL